VSAGAGQRHTFLFIDLVGFTALAAAQGDDRAAEVACELRDRVAPLLAPHRAEQVKSIGDALMLRGEDPELAVRLGVRIIDALEQAPGFPDARVGVHTGPAVERDGDWYGTTVNLAARLCSAAAGGEVLVSEATSASAGRLRHVRLGESRLHWLKNVTEPVAARPAEERACPIPFMSARLEVA
jgi:adenylate cyclase